MPAFAFVGEDRRRRWVKRGEMCFWTSEQADAAVFLTRM